MTNSYDTDEEAKKRLSAQLTNLDIGKGGVGASGRVSYKLPLDKQSELEAFANVEAQKRKGGRPSLAISKGGIDPFEMLTGGGFSASPMLGIEYTRRFKQGGKVKSASVRADGIAKRGKTKGRMV